MVYYISYKEFSKVETIEDLTGKSEDEILEIKSIKELRSMLYLGSKEGFKNATAQFNTAGVTDSKTITESLKLTPIIPPPPAEPEYIEEVITINQPIRLNNIYYDYDDDANDDR